MPAYEPEIAANFERADESVEAAKKQCTSPSRMQRKPSESLRTLYVSSRPCLTEPDGFSDGMILFSQKHPKNEYQAFTTRRFWFMNNAEQDEE